MLPLHDKTRRWMCLAGFLLLGLTPTVLVSGWCVWRHRPGHVAAEAQRLSEELGMTVSLADLSHPRPGVVRYQGLQLSDPETGQPVLRCQMLEAAWSTAQRQAEGIRTLSLVAAGSEIDAAGADHLGRLLERLLQSRCGGQGVNAVLSASEVTLRAQGDSQRLAELRASIETFPVAAQVQASFRLPGTSTPEPMRVRLVRNRQTSPPTTGFELDARGTAVPCSILALGLPGMDLLGPRSQFRGFLWANQAIGGGRVDGWNGELVGQLIDVDLEGLVSGRFPHELSGFGLVTIQSARFLRSRLHQATAVLEAGPGLISRSLIRSAVDRLHLIEGAEPPSPGDLVPYEQLALALILDPDGVQLQGRCPEASLGTILVDRQRRLLAQPVFQPQPVAALVQTLVPASTVQVPATPQTEWLIRHLPLPRAVPPATVESAPPQAALRGGVGADR